MYVYREVMLHVYTVKQLRFVHESLKCILHIICLTITSYTQILTYIQTYIHDTCNILYIRQTNFALCIIYTTYSCI